MTPLLPAPVIITKEIETDAAHLEMLKEKGIQIQAESFLPKGEAVIICINTEFLNSEKIEELKFYRETISDESIETKIERSKLLKLIESAIESLQNADPLDNKCPKIFLAIDQK